MRYFFLFLIVSTTYSQERTLDANNLPEVVKDETVKIQGEVWVEPVEAEIKQRAKINFYKKKIEKIHNVLKDKENIKHNMDSLMTVIDSLSLVRDSLTKRMESSSKNIVSDCQQKLNVLNTRFENARNQYFTVRKKLFATRRKLFLASLVCVGEAVLIIAII